MKKSVYDGCWGWVVEISDHRTFIHETAVHCAAFSGATKTSRGGWRKA